MLPIAAATIAGSSGATAGFAGLNALAGIGGQLFSNALSGLSLGGGDKKAFGDYKWIRYKNILEKYRDQDLFRQWTLEDAHRNYNQQKEFATKSTGWQFDDLMKSADRSGIHRLAALGSAGAAGYQGTNQSSMPGGASIGAPPVNEGPYLGDVIGKAISMARQQQQDSLAAQMSRKEMELLEAQTEQIRAATSRTEISNQRLAELQQGGNSVPTNDDDWSDIQTFWHSTGAYAGNYVVPAGGSWYAVDPRKTPPADIMEGLLGDNPLTFFNGLAAAGSARKVKRPGGYKGPKAPGKYGGEIKNVGGTYYQWSSRNKYWRPIKTPKQGAHP